MSSFAYINSIYLWTVQIKTHTAVPEQNSKLNIYVYIQYTVTIQLFQLKLSQTSQMYNNMSAK